MPKICIISTRPPYASTAAKDALDTALVSASYDQETSLLFLGDGIYQLIKGQQPEGLPQKNPGAMLQALEMYGIENVLVSREDMRDRGLQESDLTIPAQLLERNAIGGWLAQQDRVFNF
ncbi:sulfurtransferase complex subunit TusC [Kistimonas asteriae]|uniref:sulfurtransferase complex subunit TusC n=1 Tax=Kistimonas asteriae TaxID=517724 RepID=UPI001BA64C2A|nr:sulfurtransferase complex subunit TusC [Kistimonas asteriae]